MTFLEQILLTIVTAAATAILAYFGFWRQAKAELQKEYQSRFNERKWSTYLKFTKVISDLSELNYLNSIGDAEERGEELQKEFQLLDSEYLKEIANFESEILLIGSADVIEAYFNWFWNSKSYTYGDEESVKLIIEFINTMRKDLGNLKSNIESNAFEGIYYRSEKQKQKLEQWVEELNARNTKKEN